MQAPHQPLSIDAPQLLPVDLFVEGLEAERLQPLGTLQLYRHTCAQSGIGA